MYSRGKRRARPDRDSVFSQIFVFPLTISGIADRRRMLSEATMSHLILLGDSIFDNAHYVPGQPAVLEQVRRGLPSGWQASLLAVDGHRIEDVERQLTRLPPGSSHLIVSAGGNDALESSWILGQGVHSVDEALTLLQDIRLQFRQKYRAMIDLLAATRLHSAVCTIYDQVPGLGPAELAALAAFNEGILYEAFRARLPLIDLRLTCRDQSDYSHLSAIEPSATGGLKISRAIVELVTTHDFGSGRSVVYHLN